MRNLWNANATVSKGSMNIKPFAPMAKGSSIVQWNTNLPNFLCDEITSYYMNNCQPRDGTAKGDTAEKAARKVEARWSLPYDWVPSFLCNYVNLVNESFFQYDLRALSYTECHHLKYTPGHYYDWHADSAPEQTTLIAPPSWTEIHQDVTEYVRKISFTLQLSDEDEYTGGDVQLIDDCHGRVLVTVPKKKGSLVMFDSRIRHRVKPVKTGTRYCLVGWALGPKWK